MRRPSRDLWAILALGLVAVAVVAPSLMPGHAFLSVHSAIRPPFDASLPDPARTEYVSTGNFETGDQLFQVLPERKEFLDLLTRGEITLWWRNAGGGISLMGAPGGEFTEPRVLLLSAILGPVRALGALAVLTIFSLAGLTYWFLRLRGLTVLAAAAGGLTFALAGALSSNWYYVCKVDALVLLPAGLVSLELWLRGRQRLAFAVMALGAADSALASFPQNTATVCYALVLVGILRIRQARDATPGRPWIGGAWLLTAMVLGLAVAAFHLLPVVEWGSQSDRPFSLTGGGYVFSPAHALSLLTPLAVGDPTSALCAEFNPLPEWIQGLKPYNFTETTLYMGILGLPLTLLGSLRGRRAVPPLAGLTLALLVALGTPLAFLPGVGVSAPSRALAIVSFFLAWLCAEGIDAVDPSVSADLSSLTARRRRVAVSIGAVWLLTVAGVLALVAMYVDSGSVADAAVRARIAAGNLTGAGSLARERFAARWDLEVVPELWHSARLCLLSTVLWLFVAWRPRFRWLWCIALVADLAATAMHITPAASTRNLLEENPEIRAVARHAEPGRVARLTPELPLTPRDFEVFQATLPPYFGIADTAAYVVMPNAGQASVARAFYPNVPGVLLGDTYLTALPKDSLDSPILDLLGVSFVLSRAPLAHTTLELRCARAGFFGYERTNYLGAAWIVPRAIRTDDRKAALAAVASPGFDPLTAAVVEAPKGEALPNGAGGGQCQVSFPSNRETRCIVKGTRGGYLVTTEPMVPGWTATVDGSPATLYRTNGAFQSVFVPPGDHTVVLTYLPRSFVAGAAVSLVSILALVLFAARLPSRLSSP